MHLCRIEQLPTIVRRLWVSSMFISTALGIHVKCAMLVCIMVPDRLRSSRLKIECKLGLCFRNSNSRFDCPDVKKKSSTDNWNSKSDYMVHLHKKRVFIFSKKNSSRGNDPHKSKKLISFSRLPLNVPVNPPFSPFIFDSI